jgi:hypothetical protein
VCTAKILDDKDIAFDNPLKVSIADYSELTTKTELTQRQHANAARLRYNGCLKAQRMNLHAEATRTLFSLRRAYRAVLAFSRVVTLS